ncbi:MAG TPA: HDIG domain-containing protein [Ohtaekwangia sp.]|nr:HDIG domain-containing protein [Ohtaekwangia sp.]
MDKIDSIVTEILDLYRKFGSNDYIGEPVSQLEHMSQAAQLAINEGLDDEVVLAAFFHDIGHLCVEKTPENDMNGLGIESHEAVGAQFLRERGFSERVIRLIENHVNAKRYLTWRYPEYHASLSKASQETLKLQGGVMSDDEALLFESDPLFEMSIRLRRWDELAKIENVPTIDINIIAEKIRNVLTTKR